MKKQSTKHAIDEILQTCYLVADSEGEFFQLAHLFGITFYVSGEKMEGVIVDDTKFSLDELGYPKDVLQSLHQTLLSDEDVAKIGAYRHQLIEAAWGPKAPDIVPDLRQLEEEIKTETTDTREDELGEIRGEEGEEKEIDEGLER